MIWHILHDDPSFCLTCLLFLFFFFNTAFTASSNISFNPSWVSALHSRYLQPISYSIIFLAVYFTIGAFLGSVVSRWYFSRKSILLPTNIFTAEGTISSIYGYHYKDYYKRYFFSCINKWCWINNWESDNKHITTWIREWSQSVVLLLTSSIPENTNK